MAYLIAAYTISIGSIALYLAHLARERRKLARELAGAARGDSAPESAPM